MVLEDGKKISTTNVHPFIISSEIRVWNSVKCFGCLKWIYCYF